MKKENKKEIIQKIANLILDKTGIFFKDNKLTILEIKLNKIIYDWGIKGGFTELYEILIEDNYSTKFFDVINEISVNVTEFRRQKEQFIFMEKILIPEFLAFHHNKMNIRAWSCACSTGQEPYSIAISLLDGLHEHEKSIGSKIINPEIEIIGSDISHRALKIAESALYTLEETEHSLDTSTIHKYFQYGTGSNNGYCRIKPKIRDIIKFQYLNLNEHIPFHGEFDFVFLRNVMIYFNKEKQEDIFNKVCGTIKKGGYLFTGYSESTTGFDLPLKYLKPSIYKKM